MGRFYTFRRFSSTLGRRHLSPFARGKFFGLPTSCQYSTRRGNLFIAPLNVLLPLFEGNGTYRRRHIIVLDRTAALFAVRHWSEILWDKFVMINSDNQPVVVSIYLGRKISWMYFYPCSWCSTVSTSLFEQRHPWHSQCLSGRLIKTIEVHGDGVVPSRGPFARPNCRTTWRL